MFMCSFCYSLVPLPLFACVVPPVRCCFRYPLVAPIPSPVPVPVQYAKEDMMERLRAKNVTTGKESAEGGMEKFGRSRQFFAKLQERAEVDKARPAPAKKSRKQ